MNWDNVTEDGVEGLMKFIKREVPGSRMLRRTHLVPVSFLSQAGKNRRKKNKRRDRKPILTRLTDLG